MSHFGKENQGTNWFGALAVWLSGISMLAYFLFSETVRGYFTFLAKTLNKTVEVLLK
jgi:hypothetical protein